MLGRCNYEGIAIKLSLIPTVSAFVSYKIISTCNKICDPEDVTIEQVTHEN